VAVLMRYTLRLLTAQQFQRAAALVCSAEKMRRDAATAGDGRWGAEPFRIGLWVGGAVSPNWFDDAAEEVSDVRESGGTKRTGVLQTLVCPWCGTPLAAHRDLRADDERRRILLYCPAGEGPDACPFSETGSPGEGLPILTIDEEIYRYLPSLLVATVDRVPPIDLACTCGREREPSSCTIRRMSRCVQPSVGVPSGALAGSGRLGSD
jgi:hypothetical protein